MPQKDIWRYLFIDNIPGQIYDERLQKTSMPIGDVFFVNSVPLSFVVHPNDVPVEDAERIRTRHPNQHKHFELTMVMRGRCRISPSDAEPVELHEGDALLTGYDIVNRIDRSTQDAEILNCLFKPSFLDQPSLNRINSKDISSLVIKNMTGANKQTKSLVFRGSETRGTVQQLMLDSADMFFSGSSNAYGKSSFYTLLLLSHLAETSIEAVGLDDYSKARKLLMPRIETFIREHFDDISLEMLAHHFGYNKAYLSRLMQQETGAGYSQLLQRIRLERAGELLQSTDLPIETVAELSGFSNRSYFYRCIKDGFGLTPAEFRRSALNANR